jgi:hypothetical protein
VTDKPEGFHEHHRQKRRGGDERPVNKLYVSPILHDWIEKHPEEATALGWTVSQYADPADVVVTIPDTIEIKPKRKPKASTPAERKARVNFSIKTPKGEENILPELVESAREAWCETMGWKDDVPAYFVVVAALTKALQE